MTQDSRGYGVVGWLLLACATAGLWASAGGGIVAAAAPAEDRGARPEFRERFLALCDRACTRLNQPDRKLPFYQDSYVVRALAAAYDETGRQNYLGVCRAWSDRMIEFQNRMTPAGAYYMNYGRKPGEQTGKWYVADTSCIALGVLATAARCPDPEDRARYLASVEKFSQLVTSEYVRPSGGVTNGLWPKFNGEWWCSTGPFAALALGLYGETGKPEYLQTGIKALGWLNAIDIQKIEPYPLKEQGPSMIMYLSEAYSAAWPFLGEGEEIRTKALKQNSQLLEWATKQWAGAGQPDPWGYQSQWGSKFGGLPLLAYVSARLAGADDRVVENADKELRHLGKLISEKRQAELTQLEAFTLMSYAERVRPGEIYRSGKPAAASRRSD
jgi:hypothetical protein